MYQYSRLFGTARIPTENGCQIGQDPTSKHIVVLCHGQFYWFDVLDDNSDLIMTEKDVALNLAVIIDDAADPILLEINPRPGASMDVFERPGHPLLKIHLDACNGHLPGRQGALPTAPVRAAGFAYSDVEKIVTGAVDWPDYVSDRPMPGTVIRYGEPICTLKADGETPDAAIGLFAARLATMKNAIEGSSA